MAVTDQDSGDQEDIEEVDLQLAMVLAGFSFDAYTEVDKATGTWVSDGGTDEPGVAGVQTVLMSPRFVRDSCCGLLRVRLLCAEGLRQLSLPGAVAVAFRIEAGGPGGIVGSVRSSTRFGVLNGLARWLEEDESVYLYVPRSSSGRAEEDSKAMLHIEVQSRDLLDMQRLRVVGRSCIPFDRWGQGQVREEVLELHVDVQEESKAGEEVELPPSTLRLQLEYDPFGYVEDGPALVQEAESISQAVSDLSVAESLDDITWESRERRRRFGAYVPKEILDPQVEALSNLQLELALRRRGLPGGSEGREVLVERLQKALQAEANIRGSMWQTVESLMGSGRTEGLKGALGAVSTSMEFLSGDVLGALGAGLYEGASEVPGMKELFNGDLRGFWTKRQTIMEAAKTAEGRDAIQGVVDVAMKRARQQAMIRLAGGLELMSVRRGAWKMLEQAILDEGDGERFSEYELLAYLEARSTNTECWVWRLAPRKRLLVAFRGTCDFGDVLTDISAVPKDLGSLGRVHSGFARAYDSIKEALRAVLARGCDGDATGWELIFTGHSLGGALATLSSLDIALNKGRPGPGNGEGEPLLEGAELSCCTFGSPRVGSATLCATCDACVPRNWRIYSTSDIIPTVPPTSLFGFRHPGVAVELDPSSSTLAIRGRTPGLRVAAAVEQADATLRKAKKGESDEEEDGDVWSSFDSNEIAELQRVLGAGTQAVGEHMEDNYFQRMQDCLSEKLRRKGAASNPFDNFARFFGGSS